jgi:DnaJ homologue, subfamily C, member 28, conserved domain
LSADPLQLRASVITRRRTEPGWRAAVLDKRASRHAFRLRVSEEGSWLTSASLSERSEQYVRSERRRSSSASDDDGGGRKRDARAAGKNRDVPYEGWVDRQIREAIERGEFDNLPGQGKPIRGLNGRDDENWWVKAYLEREQLPLPLPTSLALRKEVMTLPETLDDISDERSVREIVADLNHRIAESYRRRLDGPPILVRLVDVEQAVADWRRRRS